jgi:hypothetical protein
MNFIEINDKKVCFIKKKGIYWIIVKSVCEALNVDFENQRKRINEDPILRSAPLNQTVQIPEDDQKRQYFCLPEEYVYGWIFSIQGNSEELLAYKKECYHVLFNHFHGIITKQTELYREIAKERRKNSDYENKLCEIPEYQEFIDSKMRLARLWKQVRETTSDPGFFDEDENF